MTNEQKKTTSIQLFPGQYDALKELAVRFGYYQTRGVGTRTIGSVSLLLQAIADREVFIIRTSDDVTQ
jgi:hypothetical protein